MEGGGTFDGTFLCIHPVRRCYGMGFCWPDKPDYMIAVPAGEVSLPNRFMLLNQKRKKATNRSYTASEFLIWAADTHGNFRTGLEGD